MKNEYKDFWTSKVPSEIAKYLHYAPKTAGPWERLRNADHIDYGESRYDVYTKGEISTILFADEYEKLYSWSVTHPWFNEMGSEAWGSEKSVLAARKKCDKAIKKLGWIIPE